MKIAKVKTGKDLKTELKASHSEPVFLADSFFRRQHSLIDSLGNACKALSVMIGIKYDLEIGMLD